MTQIEIDIAFEALNNFFKEANYILLTRMLIPAIFLNLILNYFIYKDERSQKLKYWLYTKDNLEKEFIRLNKVIDKPGVSKESRNEFKYFRKSFFEINDLDPENKNIKLSHLCSELQDINVRMYYISERIRKSLGMPSIYV